MGVDALLMDYLYGFDTINNKWKLVTPYVRLRVSHRSLYAETCACSRLLP